MVRSTLHECATVGIDLGTTNTLLAYTDGDGSPHVFTHCGKTEMPSVIYFDENDIDVGEAALAHAPHDPDRVVRHVKAHMGDGWRCELNGYVHTPESLSALILHQIVTDAKDAVGPIHKAVITVPAYFSEKRRLATQQAGEIAGLDVLATLNEPLAAALACDLHRTTKEEFVVVYDLGGGTFDTTVVRIAPNELHELASSGNRQLGGRDWDRMLADHVCEDFRETHHADLRESAREYSCIQFKCETAKNALSSCTLTWIQIDAFAKEHVVEVSRPLFESLTSHLLQATRLTMELALEDAGLNWGQISRVIPIGGSTHMPAVKQMLETVSGCPVGQREDRGHAVALGAAIYAHCLETGNDVQAFELSADHQLPDEDDIVFVDRDPLETLPPKHDPITDAPTQMDSVSRKPPEIRFVTAHGVGVMVWSRDEWKNAILIKKNAKVPTTVNRRFHTTGSRSKSGCLAIEIVQSDTSDPKFKDTLGVARIDVPMNEPSGCPVDITMSFDAMGRLSTRAVYVKTGKEATVSLDVPGALCEREIAAHQEFISETTTKRFDINKALTKLEEEIDDDDHDLI